MATPQLSPGTIIREVDLTVGRADNVLDNIGAIAGPFTRGPVEDPVTISTEDELIQVFGKPVTTDGQYEYWMTASSFLSYGGILKVVRTNGDTIVNASARQSQVGEITSLSYSVNADPSRSNGGIGGVYVLAQLPANQGNTGYGFTTNSADGTGAIVTVGISTTGGISSVEITNNGSNYLSGDKLYVNDFVFGNQGAPNFNFTVNGLASAEASVTADPELKIKNYSDYSATSNDIVPYVFAGKNPGTWTNGLKVCVIDDRADQTLEVGSTAANAAAVGYAVTVALTNVRRPVKRTGRDDQDHPTGISTFNGYLKGIITGINTADGKIDVKITSRVAVGSTIEEPVFYKNKSRDSSFKPGNVIAISNNSGSTVATASLLQGNLIKDWYNEQIIELTSGNVYWKSIAPKPSTNQFVLERNGKNDGIHVAIFDETGQVSGIKGNLLEKFSGLSKASDAVSAVNAPERIFWKDYIGLYSKYVFVGSNPSDKSNNEKTYATGFESDGKTALTLEEGLWNVPGKNKTFSALGNVTYTLSGGKDYTPVVTGNNTSPTVIAVNNAVNVSAASTAIAGSMKATLGDLLNAYDLFSNKDEIAVDYLLMGPGLEDKLESQAKAENLISLAGNRKDCIACISPHRSDVVNDGIAYLSPQQQTENIIEFFSTLSSSSYAIFDSGYKYTYDRFNNQFRYIPCNGDVAGLCVRTSINAYPWFSPAGQQRGILNNAVKLAFNPEKSQRDQLYSARVNPIITQQGLGTLLFGDKTALGYASAFDRINVRRLFLTVEQALQRSADAQLFEINDEITRSNFINIVEPYLSEIQAKRGIYGYLVVCDETNNTPEAIDNNEFRADIYLKPAKSINYVTITFVATRTGVSFEEVAGRV